MTIPIEPVQIHPQFAPTQQPQAPGLEVLLNVLQHRQDLNLRQQQLDREMQQLEINKKVAGPQYANSVADYEKKKRDLQRQQDMQAAESVAQRLFTGSLPHINDHQAMGEVMAGIKDPDVGGAFSNLLSEYWTNQGKQQTARSTAATATATETANTGDAATRGILAQANLGTPNGQRDAIRQILQTAGPDQAEKAANALNVGAGRFHPVVGPDGFMYMVDTKLGTSRRDATVGQRAGIGQVRLEAIKRSAGTIVDLLDAQNEIIRGSGLEGSKNPVVAQMLADARVMGVSGTAAANLFRSDPQQASNMLKTRFVHNYIGLLANARSSTPLLENLAESYWPVGVSNSVLGRAQRDRQKLRAVMIGVRDGKITDLNQVPGFTASMAAAAQEGQNAPQQVPGASAPTAPPNPDEFYKP